ncbi:MAG: recombinase family protein [Lachnospiraceae bacterium]
MSRTSRKNISIVENSKKIYRAAGYIRLSVIKDSQDRDSIENQKAIINDVLSGKSDIELQQFYVDGNVSGTSFERDGLQQMMADIEAGKIDCVVVKDLSRLGRDAIEVGFYVQHLFPQKGVRFLSVLDNFDTLDGITNLSSGAAAGLIIPLVNIFNQEYVGDIRRKTLASIDRNIHDGKCVAARAPYGYAKSISDCHQLVVDPEDAAVVKEIFAMAKEKLSLNEIVRRLNLASIPTPADYALSNARQGNFEHGDGFWNSRTVKYILTNRTYTVSAKSRGIK